jgi:hypothetical protein
MWLILLNRLIQDKRLCIYNVQNVVEKHFSIRLPSMSLHRVILLERRLRLMRVLYGN